MTQHLDSTVAQAVFTARLLETAVHTEGPWAMVWGPHMVLAKRVVTEDGVVFTAEFPETCYLEPIDSPLTLVLGDRTIAARPMDFPGDTGFEVNWTVRTRTVFASA